VGPPQGVTGVEGEAVEVSGTPRGVTDMEGEAVEVSGTPPWCHRRGGGGCGGEWHPHGVTGTGWGGTVPP